MQKILITGANGFVGNHLCELLLPDYEVIATGKGPGRLLISHPHFSYVQMDFTDAQDVESVIGATMPDVIVHGGAMSKPDDCETQQDLAWQTNVTATANLLQAAAAHKAFFVFLSTDFVFDGEKGMYGEDDQPNPVNYYGATKLEAERRVEQYLYGWSIVRTVLVYGDPKAGRQNILTTVAAALRKGEEVSIFDDQVRTPTYVGDLARAIKTIIDKKATGIFHISGSDVRTPYQMAVETARHLGLNEKLVKKVIAGDLVQPAKRPPRTGFYLTRAKDQLGYEPTSFEEGLKLTFGQVAGNASR